MLVFPTIKNLRTIIIVLTLVLRLPNLREKSTVLRQVIIIPSWRQTVRTPVSTLKYQLHRSRELMAFMTLPFQLFRWISIITG